MANNQVYHMGNSVYAQDGTAVQGLYLYFQDLGERKFLTLQRYDGKIAAHIRNYVLDEQNFVLVPCKRGVTLDK